VPITNDYLGRTDFARALDRQRRVADDLRAGRAAGGTLIGFESEPVITLGLRATAADAPAARLPMVRVDRGGQATLHHPGQLVIFPVVAIGGRGSRTWVDLLVRVTRRLAADLGHPLEWREDSPGLYDSDGGKVASLGLRIRGGISTHGLAINVRNRLADFDQIRTCGRANAPVAHLRTDLALAALFDRWAILFVAEFV
jgi:lipoyl(octanoyl) transferase